MTTLLARRAIASILWHGHSTGGPSFVEEVFLGGDAIAAGAAPLGPVAGVHVAAGPFGGGGVGHADRGQGEECWEDEVVFDRRGFLLVIQLFVSR